MHLVALHRILQTVEIQTTPEIGYLQFDVREEVENLWVGFQMHFHFRFHAGSKTTILVGAKDYWKNRRKIHSFLDCVNYMYIG
jgi:hypothetical protein